MIASEQFLQHLENDSSHLLPSPPPLRTFAKRCACVLVLLMPGSFEVLTVLWLYRQWQQYSALKTSF